jgi:hypothetical protein
MSMNEPMAIACHVQLDSSRTAGISASTEHQTSNIQICCISNINIDQKFDIPLKLSRLSLHFGVPTFTVMLRRPPTAITLTQEDVARYDEMREQRLQAQRQQQIAQSDVFTDNAASSSRNNNGAAEKQKPRTAEQRIMGR